MKYIDENRIENFIYTMVKFDLSDCAVMVCVSDPKCMERCQESLFPCVDFQYKQYHPVSEEYETLSTLHEKRP